MLFTTPSVTPSVTPGYFTTPNEYFTTPNECLARPLSDENTGTKRNEWAASIEIFLEFCNDVARSSML